MSFRWKRVFVVYVCVKSISFCSAFSQTQDKQAEFSFTLVLSPNIVCSCINFPFSIPWLLYGVGLEVQKKGNLILLLCVCVRLYFREVNSPSTKGLNCLWSCCMMVDLCFSCISLLHPLAWIHLMPMHLIACTNESIKLKRTKLNTFVHINYAFASTLHSFLCHPIFFLQTPRKEDKKEHLL